MHAPSVSLTIFPLMVAMLGVVGLSASAQAPNPDTYRKYALTHQGDAARGRGLGTQPQRVVSFSDDAADNLYADGQEGTNYKMDFTEARFE